MATNLELAQLSEAVYTSGGGNPGGNWTFFTDSSSLGVGLSNGYYAVAYRNIVTNEIVFAHRGLQPTDGQDVVAVLKVAAGKIPEQFNNALTFYERVRSAVRIDPNLSGLDIRYAHTGHSLGGALANLMGVHTGEPVVGFNSLGVQDLVPAGTYANIRNISAAYDPARLVGTRIGSVRNVFVSSYAFVFDVVEPLFAGVLATQAGLLPLYHFAYSQHLIKNMVETLAALPEGSEGIPPASIPLSFDENYQLSGPAVDEWNSLDAALNSDSSLEQNLTNPTYDDEGQLANAAIRAEQTVDLDASRGYDATGVPAFIAGGNGSDFLRGGSGSDFIFADDGNDTLDGEGGNDILIGGSGFDTYRIRPNDGNDIIIDTDGKGLIVYGPDNATQALALGIRDASDPAGQYHSLDGSILHQWNGSSGDLLITLQSGQQLTVKDFHPGDLHIALLDRPAAPAPPQYVITVANITDHLDPAIASQSERILLSGTFTGAFGLGGDDVIVGDGQNNYMAGDDSPVNSRIPGFSPTGADTLEGRGGNDVVDGGLGDDAVFADAETTLSAFLATNPGATAGNGDWLNAGPGRDTVLGSTADDVLLGGGGEDVLAGGAGADVLSGDGDGVYLYSDAAWRVVHPGSFETRLDGPTADSIAHLDDTTRFPGGADVLYGGGGDDWLHGNDGDDVLFGGADNDVLLGNNGADALFGGAGADRLNGESLTLDANGNFIDTRPGDDYLDGGEGNDTLYGMQGDDLLFGGEGNDTLYGDYFRLPANLHGDDILDGGAGADTLDGGGGDDTLDGGTGNDTLDGDEGNDTYVFNAGDGQDTLLDRGGLDNIVFHETVAADSVHLSKHADLITSTYVLAYGDAGDTLTLEAGLGGLVEVPIEYIQLAGLGSFSVPELIARQGGLLVRGTDPRANLITGSAYPDLVQGNLGDDFLYAGDADDILDGGAGNDTLDGGLGNDTYLLDLGDGVDRLQDSGGLNTVRFGPGLTPADIRFALQVHYGSRHVLQVHYGGAGDRLDIAGGLRPDAALEYEFADGRRYTQAELIAATGGLPGAIVDPGLPDQPGVAPGNDYPWIPGQSGRAYVAGDPADGYDGFVIVGTEGNDEIEDNDYGDTFLYIPGRGNDTINSYAGDFFYLLNRGDGHDVISGSTDSEQTVHFGPGIALTSLRLEVAWSYWRDYSGAVRRDGDLLIHYGDQGDGLLVYGALSEVDRGGGFTPWGEDNAIETFVFADDQTLSFDELIDLRGLTEVEELVFDPLPAENELSPLGTAPDTAAILVGTNNGLSGEIIYGNAAANVITGTPRDDALYGGAGGDTLRGQDGNDFLYGEDGNDLLAGEGGDDTLDGGAGDDRLEGGDGSDSLVDRSGGNTFVGGPGDDRLVGGNGTNAYFYNLGDGLDRIETARFGQDTVYFGAGIGRVRTYAVRAVDAAGNRIAEVRFLDAAGNPLPDQGLDIVTLPASESLAAGQSFEFGVERFVFADGVEADLGFLLDNAPGPRAITGTPGNDILSGTAGNDTLQGGAGDDTLNGGAGSDTYVFNLGDGVDTVMDAAAGGDTNIIVFGSDIAASSLSLGLGSLLIHYGNQGDAIHIEDFNPNDAYNPLSIGEFRFADGTVLTYADLINLGFDINGTDGDDTLTGTSATDRITGGLGSDILTGGAGDDTYFYTLGDGYDTITDTAGTDTLALSGVTLPDLNTSISGDDLILELSDGNTITIQDWFVGTDNQIETITLDGVSYAGSFIEAWGHAPILAALVPDTSTDEDSALSLGIGTYFTDADLSRGDVLTYSAALAGNSDLPTWLVLDATTGSFTGIPLQADVGSLDIQITATDAMGRFASEAFTLTVNNVNDVPIVANSITDQTTDEDSPLSFTLPINTFADEDSVLGDTLTLSAVLADGSVLPDWLAFATTTGTFSGTPDNGQVGSYDIQVTATDLAGASASDVFTLTVNNVNDIPVIVTPIVDVATDEDSPFSFTLADIFTDDDLIHGDTLTLSAVLADGSVLPDWLTFDAATGTFTGTPDNWDVGAYEVRVAATDTAGTSVFDDLTLTVNNTNDAPILANAIVDQTATEGAAFSYALPGNTFHDDDAIHGDVLSYTANLTDGSALPAWLTFDTATQTFTGTASPDSILVGTDGNDVLVDTDTGIAGTWNIKVTATDTAGVSAEDSFRLTLQGVAENDTLIGGKGNDALNGGGGNDTYIYNLGDGLDQLTDRAGTDTVQFGAGFSFDNIVIRTEGGIAHLRFLDADGCETQEGMDIALNGDGSSPIESFAFADGSTYNLADLAITTQTWYGDMKANTIITGRNDDTVYAGKGGDTVYARTGNDTLYGEKGNDRLYGEGGNDRLYGGKGDDLLNGGCGNDFLDGGKGKNILIGGKGDDTLILGNDGENTILFNKGDDWDIFKTATKDEGHDNEVRFGQGITQNNLWFSRSGNNLQVNILGTQTGMTIEGWYNNKHRPIEEIKTSNGYELEDKQIDLLVQAMAAFTPTPGSGIPLPTEMPDQLQATLAAAWEN